MKPDTYCKGCQATVRLDDGEITKIFDEKFKVKSVKLVTEDLYQSRLAICSLCDYLDYGTTCRQCGCLIQIKAKLAGAYCPYPNDPKW
jgi:hypothetical protein